MPFLQYTRLLIGSIIIAILGLGGALLIEPETNMRINPESGTYRVGESFIVDIVVESHIPVNVFKGELFFDPEIIYVDAIEYNTSIADLWAERPWYSNGIGTLNFIGGTTQSGGFIGTGKLISVTFTTKQVGDASIRVDGVRILKHDGLGSEAVVAEPIDNIFIVEDTVDATTVFKKDGLSSILRIVAEQNRTDLNGDGQQTFTDISIFLGHFATRDKAGDLNGDGKVNMADMSIMLDAE